MSTGRNAPLMSDSRYPPERSPPRNPGGSAFRGARSASGGFGPPRGPKAFDTPRGPGPFRGRGGYPPRDEFRNEYRERDREPFRPRDLSPRADDRERWRERDFDRRDQRPPLRGRPHSDFRDFRDAVPPRDADDRRPPPRDEPSPSTPYFSEFRGDFRGRGGFSRGRGRGDWDRGRRRDSFRDERDFRPRSRSPPEFRDREGYRDEKPFDRRGSRMSDQRVDERSAEGDEHDRFRREPYSGLDDPRRASNPSTAPSTPQPQSAGPRPVGEPPRELNPPRRISSFATPAANKDPRPEPPRPDYLSGRPELTRDRHGGGTSSPPQAPSVPAFGTFNVKPSNDLPWNVWKAPTTAPESKPEKLATSPITTANNSVPKSVPAAPKVEVERHPPTGPKAQRSMETLSEKAPLVPSDSIAGQREEISEQRAVPPQPSPRLAFNEKPDQVMGGMETAQMKPISQPPTGPRASIRQEPPPKPAAQSPPLSPAALKVPTGPRASTQVVPGAFPGTSIPTAPKAIRNAPIVPFGAPAGPAAAIGPRGRLGTMPRSPEAMKVIPAKREFVGEQKFAKRPDFGSATRSAPSIESVDTRISNGPEAILATQIKREESDALAAPKTLSSNLNDQATGKENFRPGFEDEDNHLDEFDFDENEVKFQREKALRESKKVDLSSRHLRAATPLEHLAFLSRINMEDPLVQLTLQQIAEETPAPRAGRKTKTPAPQQPQLPETPTPAADPTPPSESPPPVLSPELNALPFLNKAPTTPFSEIEAVRQNEERHARSRQFVRRKIVAKVTVEQDREQELVPEFIVNYLEWREKVDEFDNQRAEDEKEEQHVVVERKPSAPPQDASPIVNPALPAEGGRRTRGAFTTEYEMEQILKESEEMERQAQIKREREAQTAEPDMDKEAEVPTLLQPREMSLRRFQDYSQLVKQSDDTYFSYAFHPPKDDFSEQEHQTLLHNFKEYPKKFGKIAQALPHRNYKDCINHYYATKWTKEFKAPRDKRVRRGVKKSRINQQARPVSLISNLDGARPDLYDGEEFSQPVIAVTDSGRPRRAAAPTFGDKDGDDQGSSTATPEGKRRGQDRESGTEKARRPRGTTREKPPRKPRQSAMRLREPSMSPEKSDSGPHPYNSHNPQTPVGAGNSMHSTLELEAANVLGGLGTLHPSAEQSQTIAPSTEIGHGGFGGAEINKPLTSEQRHHKVGNSSYWSVQEVNNFPQYVSHYGTDWNAISQHMGTKSSTMVKNYYFRLINSNSKPQLKELATAADEKRAEGGNLGSPPAPAPTQHRQKQPTRQLSTRVIMPNPSPSSTQPEVIELDEDEPPHRPPQYGMIGQSPAFSPGPRFKHAEQGLGHSRPVARAEHGDQSIQPSEMRFQPAHEPIAAGSRQGQRVAQVSEIGGPSRPILVDQTLEKQEQRRISGDDYLQLKGAPAEAWRLQPNPEPPRNANGQDHRMALASSSYRGSPEAGYGKIQAPRQDTERPRELETTYPGGLHRQRPVEFMQNPHETRSQPEPGPQRVTVTQPEQAKQGYGTGAGAADAQVALRVENAPKPTVPASRPEPQKRSNIMNILNNEPDEPAPSHSSSSRTPVQSLQSPAPSQPRIPTMPQRSASNPDRQDEFADLRRGGPVSSFATVPHPSSFSRSSHEVISREVPMAIPQRPDWTSQVFAPSAGARQRTATRPEEKTGAAMYPEIQRHHNASPLPLGSREHVRRLSQKEQQHSPHQQPPPPVLQPEFHPPSGRPPHIGSMSAQPVSHQRQVSEGDRRAIEKDAYLDRSKYEAWMSTRGMYAREEKPRPNPPLSRQDSGNKPDERATSRMSMYAEPALAAGHDVVRGSADPFFRAPSSMQHREHISFHGPPPPQAFSRNMPLDPREPSSKDSVTREQDRAYLHDGGRPSQTHAYGEPRRMDPGMAYRHEDLDARRAAVGVDPLYPHITPAEQQQQRHREVAARAPYWRESHYGAMRPGEKPRDM